MRKNTGPPQTATEHPSNAWYAENSRERVWLAHNRDATGCSPRIVTAALAPWSKTVAGGLPGRRPLLRIATLVDPVPPVVLREPQSPLVPIRRRCFLMFATPAIHQVFDLFVVHCHMPPEFHLYNPNSSPYLQAQSSEATVNIPGRRPSFTNRRKKV